MVKGLMRGVGNPSSPQVVKETSIVGIERAKLISAQKECPKFGVIYAACAAADQDGDSVKVVVQRYFREHPDHQMDRKVDAIVNTSLRYELVDGLLMRRVYDVLDREVQLRIVAPEGSTQKFESVGKGPVPLEIRSQILLEYHNGPLGGHLGADKTATRVLNSGLVLARHLRGCRRLDQGL